ncbi:hypothetical protein HNR55_001554 [Acetobacter lovaniensis]|uniref:Uncharacterized protein n=1 Tax=Acetobacter lovaniensis TaxID=104100 RepID=A0A841QEK2_9PROT|nr:hypothetical protein [Acetobacter lovaniensis]
MAIFCTHSAIWNILSKVFLCLHQGLIQKVANAPHVSDLRLFSALIGHYALARSSGTMFHAWSGVSRVCSLR